jgi:hypothetical protein
VAAVMQVEAYFSKGAWPNGAKDNWMVDCRYVDIMIRYVISWYVFSKTAILYLLPLIPIFSRAVLCLRFKHQMNEVLPEEAADREAHRALILPLAGFSFTGLIGLIVVDAALRLNYKVAIYYLLVSFLAFMLSLNVQGYKSTRCHDQISTGIMDSGSLSLVLAACYLIWWQAFGVSFSVTLIVIASGAWLADHVKRVSLMWRHLSRLSQRREVND